ncbi:M56 family metallopeptidase [Oscillibacter sp. MSJ-31]|uniref:M56 family metallopeptidase n=1 Tax=Oscillibacter sp. MSJ-31 TaxID=2841526 RepID=UPI001C109618|nr:M56 family metallopeptidase [Oscillibacter sp. MSJ-31]MBU5456366.1 M56 family metallopeptidase [Oscillibacter sp. MSJ-31]
MMQWIVSSSVLILVVIALRYVLRGKLSLRMQYALWLLVLVRLLVPVSFGASDLSVMNAVPERAPTVQQGTYKQDIVGERNDAPANAGTVGIPAQSMNEAAPPDLVQNVTTATVTAPTVEKTDWARIAKTVWLAGAAALGLVFLAVNLRFGKKLRRSRERVEETDACLPVYESGETDTPCLFGVAKPSIYVTPDTRTEAETLRYALAHEQTHYRHGDNLWAVLRGVCLALHWYNPLVWWAAELSRRDAELACDEATIRRIGESERAAYGRTLIRMTCEKRPALLVTATMMTDSGKGLKERISLLVKKPKTAAYTAIAVLLIAGLSVACTFTGGRDDAELADPFGRDYEAAEVMYQAPEYDFSLTADTAPYFRIGADGQSLTVVDLNRNGLPAENLYGALEEYTLTKENFDDRFRAAEDGTSGWADKTGSAASLRRENAKAWHCTAAEDPSWPEEIYLLQQKDGTLYLIMGYDCEASERFPDGLHFFRWLFRLTEKAVPTYDSMEAYALSVINALKQPNGYTYCILPDGAQSSADGTPIEVTEAAADVRVTELEKLGDCADLAPDGTLELWSFSYEVKPEDKAGALPDRFFWVGGNNITDDGYISDGFYYYLTVLRTNGEPGVYKLLDSHMANDGLWYNGCTYTSAYEYLYDFYADYASLDVPRYMIHVYFNGDELSRENVAQTSDDCEARRYDGDGWYIYLSTVVWKKTKGEDSWYSGYYTGSALRVDKSYDSVKAMEDFYRDSGFTLKQYREGAALSGPWLRYDAESGTQFANYLAENTAEGGCYIISTYWVPTDEIVTNQWGEWDKGAQVEREAIWLRGMAQSFTVAPGLERQYEAPAEESASQPTEPEVTVEPATAEKTPEELRADILKTADRTLEQGGYLWYIADGALSRCDANGGVEQLYKLPSSELSPVLIEKLNVYDDMVLLAYRVGGGFMGSTKQCLFNSKTGGVAYELADCADFLIDGDTVVKTDSFAAPTTGNLSISRDRGKTWEKLGDPSYIYDRPVTLREDGSISADATSNTFQLEGGYLYTTGAYWGEGSAQPDEAVPVRVDLATGETVVLNNETAPTDESQTAA